MPPHTAAAATSLFLFVVAVVLVDACRQFGGHTIRDHTRGVGIITGYCIEHDTTHVVIMAQHDYYYYYNLGAKAFSLDNTTHTFLDDWATVVGDVLLLGTSFFDHDAHVTAWSMAPMVRGEVPEFLWEETLFIPLLLNK